MGGQLLATFVLISVLGTLNATVLIGPRIAYAMALDGLFMSRVGRAHPRYRTPAAAIVLQALVSVGILLVFGNFEDEVEWTVAAYFVTAIDSDLQDGEVWTLTLDGVDYELTVEPVGKLIFDVHDVSIGMTEVGMLIGKKDGVFRIAGYRPIR